MTEIHFSNYQLEPDTEYFLYIGELKNYGLNVFLKEALSRIYNRKFDFIAIVPDLFEQYNYDGIVVINPAKDRLACKFGPKLSCRVSAREFMDAVSRSPRIRSLIGRLLNRQEQLFLYMYESLPEMTLGALPGVRILGPKPEIATRINSKSFQYEHLSDQVPVVDFKICRGLDALVESTDSLWDVWTDGIFVSEEYSAAGVNSIVARDQGDILGKFQDRAMTYVASRYIPHEHDPTVLAVVAGPGDVYIAGIADQRIEDGNRFTGSTFPTCLGTEIQRRLCDHTRAIGTWMAEQGYRGIFGCDFLVGPDSDVRFLEINARKQGTTLEFCCTLEQSLPSSAPMLPELEFYAVKEGLLPANVREALDNPRNLHWGTYNYKLSKTVYTNGYIPQSALEREAFRKVGNGNLKKDFMILEHTGSDFVVAEGSFIGRIVALGGDHQSVDQGLFQGRRTIELTIDRDYDQEASHG